MLRKSRLPPGVWHALGAVSTYGTDMRLRRVGAPGHGETGTRKTAVAGRRRTARRRTAPRPAGQAYASGRTTPRIGIDPAPPTVTVRPGRGAWMIAPSPT
ncbi:hypothetical protein GCM10010339_13400 [Streptomyces alanosinicus]|uniref:Uncharacterized protein n=1 Tax=Streptomyces alanosinicus TaxID=68171 RepID=A0A918YDA9_9ACTN|nr:hypothetical protein GCM10010339_13400 [Streptomyces alanosinicus]